ncbi:hypothetical protein L2E82_01636 [Cichorium intybus]|uniref:Uncharacterized protein n=1 Tax=Cichorium intybus TaxID=13427 RepID=A0ACB9GZ50_CICIN|nr:hypothetical protein L2E82_01636 [Cichorium intybus]
MHSQHQIAARYCLKAYRLRPENALLNLCAGTALINLALGTIFAFQITARVLDEEWMAYFKDQNYIPYAINSHNKDTIKEFLKPFTS